MQEYLAALSTLHPFAAYFAIMAVGLAEGPILAILCGLMLAGGYLNFFGVYIALMLGDLIGDIIWYYIGYHFGYAFVARFGKYFNITEQHITKVKDIFHRYKHRILFISKLTTGFGFAVVVLFTAGLSKIPFGRYITINIIGQFLWSGFLIFLGYFFGSLYAQIESVLGRIFLIAAVAILIALAWGVRNYVKAKLKIE